MCGARIPPRGTRRGPRRLASTQPRHVQPGKAAISARTRPLLGVGQEGRGSSDPGQLPRHAPPVPWALPAPSPAPRLPRPGEAGRAEAAGPAHRGSLCAPCGPARKRCAPGRAAGPGFTRASWEVSFRKNHYGGRLDKNPAGKKGGCGPAPADPREAGQGRARGSERELGPPRLAPRPPSPPPPPPRLGSADKSAK